MKIQFKLDGKLYRGTAEVIQSRSEIRYQVDLADAQAKPIRFVLCADGEGNWETDDMVSPGIAYAAGMEIDRFDDGYDEIDLPPNQYYSSNPTPLLPMYKHDEIINRPENVEERSAG